MAGLTLGVSEAYGKPGFALARATIDWKGDGTGYKIPLGPKGHRKPLSDITQDLLSEGSGLLMGKAFDGGGASKNWNESGITQGRTYWTNVNDPKRIWKFGADKAMLDIPQAIYGGVFDAVIKQTTNFDFLDRTWVTSENDLFIVHRNRKK